MSWKRVDNREAWAFGTAKVVLAIIEEQTGVLIQFNDGTAVRVEAAASAAGEIYFEWSTTESLER